MAVIIGEWGSERRLPARQHGLERRLQPAPAAAGRGTGPPLPASAAEATWTAGIQAGSTGFRFEAPWLSEAAPEQFAVPSLWGQAFPAEATALDLVADAIQESQSSSPSGERFDASVLAAVVEMTKVPGNPEVRCELIPHGFANASFALDRAARERIQGLLDAIPSPQTSLVTGRLDAIKHEGGRFQIVLDQGARLPGRLDSDALDKEVLRPLWGREATVMGTVRFRPNGRPQFIEARRITAHDAGDEVFAELPDAEPVPSRTLFPRPSSSEEYARPRDLAGAWPGNETVEELLVQLD